MTTSYNHGKNIDVTSQITNDKITFGNGVGHYMSVTGDVTSDTINFGNGNDDYIFINPNNLTVNPNTGVGTFFLDHDTIVFGNGSQDYITIINGNMDYDNIAFGSGSGDKVSSDAISYSNDISRQRRFDRSWRRSEQ
jgi:hypothetical protein